MNLEIREMTLNDLNSIADTLEENFDSFWTYSVFQSELENPNSYYLVAVLDNEIVGFSGIWISFEEAHLMNIVTRKDKRHLGIATSLLESLISIAKNKSLTSLTLEVKQTNTTAISLYEKFNFKKIGVRKNYYDKIVNAIIMTLYFNE